MKIKTLLLVASMILFSISFGSLEYVRAASSIGVSPSQISNHLLVPGVQYKTVLVVSRATATDDVSAKVEIFGDSIASWIAFPQGNTVMLPKGVQRMNIEVLITVPQDTKVGDYKGNLRLTLTNTKEGQINIVPGVRVDVDLKVTNQTVEGIKILYIKMLESAVGSPYVVFVQVNNTGNVEVRPDAMTLEIFDIGENKLRTLSYTFADNVPAFQTKELQALVQDADPLPIGEYWAVITIKKDEKVIATEKVSFRIGEAVTPTPTPSKSGTLSSSSPLLWGIFAVIGILVISGLTVIFFAFFKRNEKKEPVPVS
jgi:hypothetical protein